MSAPRKRPARTRTRRGIATLLGLVAAGGAARAQAPAGAADADRFSRAFLGAYRLTMEIEPQLLKHCKTYGVDPDWARAICMYESGGNPDLNSHMGAQGYFQVMPRTYRGLGVTTNIEAGIKYLSQMQARYDREDYATAAYNGGPLFVDKDRAFKLETLQYVIGVGHFRTVLQHHEDEIRAAAAPLKVRRVKAGETWWSLSREVGIPIIELRMYNPFHAHRGTLKEGNLVAHPAATAGALPFTYADGYLGYRSRIGDNPFYVAFVFDMPLDEFRKGNAIWRLQSLPPGVDLRLDLRRGTDSRELVIREGDDLVALAGGDPDNVWSFIRDAGLFDQKLTVGRTSRLWLGTTTPTAVTTTASAEPAAAPTPPKPVASGPITYAVKRGDTLHSIARMFNTTADRLRAMNRLRKSTTLQPGQKLKVPSPAAEGG